MGPQSSKNTPYYYNRFSSMLVENFENRAFGQTAEAWCLATFRTVADTYEIRIGEGLSEVVWGYLPTALGKAYPWFHLGLKDSEGGYSRNLLFLRPNPRRLP